MTAIPECVIRRGGPDDCAALASLLREIGWFEWVQAASDDDAAAAVRKQLERCTADDSHSVYLAERGDALVGYVSVHWLPYLTLEGPEGFLSGLFVAEGERGRGIGTRLIRAVEEEARGRSCVRLQLVNFRQRESYLRGFYRKAGWEERPNAANFVRRLDT